MMQCAAHTTGRFSAATISTQNAPKGSRFDKAGQTAASLPGQHDSAAAEVRPALAQRWSNVRAALVADLRGNLIY